MGSFKLIPPAALRLMAALWAGGCFGRHVIERAPDARPRSHARGGPAMRADTPAASATSTSAPWGSRNTTVRGLALRP
jgi:hypothetical protein